MTRHAIQNWGGVRQLSCDKCATFITNREQVCASVNKFMGHLGTAILVNRAANLRYGGRKTKTMKTGRYIVRDVFCIVCEVQLGWFYEFAMKESERNKEGKICLERTLLCEKDDRRPELAKLIDCPTHSTIPY